MFIPEWTTVSVAAGWIQTAPNPLTLHSGNVTCPLMVNEHFHGNFITCLLNISFCISFKILLLLPYKIKHLLSYCKASKIKTYVIKRKKKSSSLSNTVLLMLFPKGNCCLQLGVNPLLWCVFFAYVYIHIYTCIMLVCLDFISILHDNLLCYLAFLNDCNMPDSALKNKIVGILISTSVNS